METTSALRWVRLNGATNVRDLGGYAAGGRTTRWGKVYRSDGLHRLDADDQQALIDRGVRMVIDLRHASETESQPNVFAASEAVQYVNIPLFRAAPAAASTSAVPDLPTIYRYIVDECQAGLREVMEAIAGAGDGAVVFHCTAGKDRTGIVTALLLGAAGVDAETIADDYALTTEAMQHLRPHLLAQAELAGGGTEHIDRLLSSHREDMLSLLGYMGERYGDAAAYLRSLGLSDAQIDRLRALLLDAGDSAQLS
jgi:protein-tyrosine phosphatase